MRYSCFQAGFAALALQPFSSHVKETEWRILHTHLLASAPCTSVEASTTARAVNEVVDDVRGIVDVFTFLDSEWNERKPVLLSVF